MKISTNMKTIFLSFFLFMPLFHVNIPADTSEVEAQAQTPEKKEGQRQVSRNLTRQWKNQTIKKEPTLKHAPAYEVEPEGFLNFVLFLLGALTWAGFAWCLTVASPLVDLMILINGLVHLLVLLFRLGAIKVPATYFPKFARPRNAVEGVLIGLVGVASGIGRQLSGCGAALAGLAIIGAVLISFVISTVIIVAKSTMGLWIIAGLALLIGIITLFSDN